MKLKYSTFGVGNMSFNANVYKILIASPSDVETERDQIPQFIYNWNSMHSETSGVVLLPVKWETHSRPEMGTRGQEILNQQFVKDCDAVIGLFWSRLGTSTGVAESGTVEEIDLMIEEGKPALIYFSNVALPPSKIDLKQMDNVNSYKKKIQIHGIYGEYSSIEQLKDLIHRHLYSLVIDGKFLNDKKRNQDRVEPATSTLKKADHELLDKISFIYSGDSMYNFFENLSESRMYHIELADKYEHGLRRYTAPDAVFRNETLQNAKTAFLDALDKFMAFAGETFNTTNGVTAKFYGGINEYDLMTTFRDKFENDEKIYIELARELHLKWADFQAVVREQAPDFQWR